MNEESVDILIAGGGLTGATLLLALSGRGFRVRLVDVNAFEDRMKPDFDVRTLAISPASVRILDQLGLWSLLAADATPIDAIEVSERNRFGMAHLKRNTSEPLGYVLEMPHINRALMQLLNKDELLAPAELVAIDRDSGIVTIKEGDVERFLRPTLIVAADGSSSSVRRLADFRVNLKSWPQKAIVANIGLKRPHQNMAFERFTASGPLAMLPMTQQRSALVWALKPEDATRLMALDEAAFLKELQLAFGYRLGRFCRVGARKTWPLQQLVMPKQTEWPFVFVGNAAHTLHPVAGQGFNLGLRDVAMLAQSIIEKGLNPDMLAHYQAARKYDQSAIIRVTQGLVGLFTCSWPGMGQMRSLGLVAFDNLPFLKQTLSRHTQGFAGVVPDLACGIALQSGESV